MMKEARKMETTPYIKINGAKVRELVVARDGSMARASSLYGRSRNYIANCCLDNRMSEECLEWIAMYVECDKNELLPIENTSEENIEEIAEEIHDNNQVIS